MIRIGFGYDSHRLVAGRSLILGGTQIPHSEGLIGHSDADVVCHALMDALLGSLALGDIGGYFPPSDPRFANADSVGLLEHVLQLVNQQSFRLINTDIVIVAEAPKLSGYLGEMRSRLAEALDTSVEAVSIKATTNEGLGPEGRREAISARAVVLVESV